MAATGYTPISLYYSTTASAVPTSGNLANGELALNIADMKLYAKNSAGTVTLLASNASTTGVDSLSFGSTGLTPSSATTGAITVAGTLNVANGGTGLTSLSANRIPYGNGTSAFQSSTSLTYSNGLIVNGVTQAYNTTLYNTDGSLSNYSAVNGVYLNGNTSGWVGISGDGTNASYIRIYGTSYGTPNIIQFNTASTERGRFDASGNFILGTTTALSPSAGRVDLTVNGTSTSIVSLGIGGTRQGYLYAPTGGIILASETGGLNLTTTTAQPVYLTTNNSERLRIASTGAFGLSGANYGTAGQVLTSGGSGSAPTWATAGGGTTMLFCAFSSAMGL